MKASTVLTVAVHLLLTPAFTRATPAGTHLDEGPGAQALQVRAPPPKGVVENEVRDGTACKETMFFFVRGSTQQANMGLQPGPQVAAYLRYTLGKESIAVQGIEYPAKLMDNLCLNNKLCRPKAATKAASQLRDYMDKCPDASVLLGGYSQGAAMLSRMIERLEQPQKTRITAVVTFGNTLQLYNNEKLPSIDKDKVKMFCNKRDPVCAVGVPLGAAMPGHRNYRPAAREAAAFLVGKLAAARGWSTTPEVGEADLSTFASTRLLSKELYSGAPLGTSVPFDDTPDLSGMEDIKVNTIYGRGGARVNFLGVKIDGRQEFLEHGGGGGAYQELVLEVDEYWVETELCTGYKKGKARIGYFKATTTQSRTLELGKKDEKNGKCVVLKAEEPNSFVGLFGESGEEVDSVGLVEFPITY